MASLRRRNIKKSNEQMTHKTYIKSKDKKDVQSAASVILSDLEQCKQMFAFLIPHKYMICIQLAATMGHIMTRMLFPIVVGFAISSLTSKSEQIIISEGIMNSLCTNSLILDCSTKHSLLNTTLYLMIFVNLSQTFFNFLRGYFGQLTSQRISATIRNKLFHCILFNDLSFFDDTKCGILLNRLSSDCTQFTHFCTDFIPKIMDNLFGLLLSLSYALYISHSLTFLMLTSVPISSFLSRHFSIFYAKLSQKMQQKLAEFTNIAFESISNIKTIKAFSNESNCELLFAKQIEKSYKYSANIAFYRALFEAIITALAFLSIASVLWYSSNLYLSKQINAGNAVSFIIISIQISNYLKRSSNIFSDFMKNIGATKRIFVLVNGISNIAPFGGDTKMKPMQSMYSYHNPSKYENEQSIDAKFEDLIVSTNDAFVGNIEFENVCFCYPSPQNQRVRVLDNLSFCVSVGETVAFVGESGMGKTTIIILLMRFYDPLSGQIFIDGINLKHYNLEWLHREKIGYVQQEPSLFNASIKENICLHQEELDMDGVIDAAKKAQCYSFISKFENGFDTVCGERGCQISGGQKQRIAIARAIYNNPNILILDEASSALDAENEYLLHRALKNMANEKQKTIMIIAHRLSSIKNANKIFVIKNGQIIQSGSHSQLIQIKDGEYFNLIQRQVFVE